MGLEADCNRSRPEKETGGRGRRGQANFEGEEEEEELSVRLSSSDRGLGASSGTGQLCKLRFCMLLLLYIGGILGDLRRSSGKEGRQEGDMAPSKGRDLAPLRDMGRDLPQLRRESAPIKGRAMNRKSSGWMGTSWRTLLLGLIFLVLAATTLMISQVFDDKLHPAQIVKGLPFTTKIMPQQRILEDTTKVLPHSSGLLSVRDIVAFPDEVMLLVRTVYRAPIPRKSALMCMFGKKERTGIYTIEWKDESRTLLAVRCEHPTMALNRSKDATLVFSHSNIVLPTAAQYLSNSSWKPLVYETLTLADSVLLFAKGLVDSQGRPNNHSKELHKLHCSFGQSEHGGALVQTAVKVIAQEVIGALRSVAYFDIPASAHFLTEWIMYHGFLGIEKWFLYDNNSDDNIDEVLDGLAADYNLLARTSHARTVAGKGKKSSTAALKKRASHEKRKVGERHKSFVLLDALSDTLLNVVHHFRLADGYKEMAVHARVAVINHYKYQAWEVFKAKFVRRVATTPAVEQKMLWQKRALPVARE
ncbi:hypothetical protein AXG93_1976s1480 [Marchantia polymorpha subsp. ruderalis]|uniref:Glycosyltransferase family 92 protein n=1 Tax=Marchantia polymorpha subsp. ruderalis TaxID=1480154 RepID=A0A176VF52_MARPO|nr:hypothetical protein AXG93_1976s1480 [Marchantia polymorpha subsp. ruderalis]